MVRNSTASSSGGYATLARVQRREIHDVVSELRAAGLVELCHKGHRDELVVSVVSDAMPEAIEAIERELEEILRDRVGIQLALCVESPGALDAWTEIRTSPKPKRFRDER